MITVIAILCSMTDTAGCREMTVTNSDLSGVTMQACLMGPPQLAEWMNDHPAERLAGWRCVSGRPAKAI